MSATAVIDVESAREFMREALGRVSLSELDAIADELERRHGRMQALLADPRRRDLDAAALRSLLRSIFATRRRADQVLARVGPDRLATRIEELLDGTEPIPARLQVFHDRLDGVPPGVRWDLASELLHGTDPGRYWLWTRWIWDPEARTGALPLVTTDAQDLAAETVGETYLRVGRAISSVHGTGHAAGFTRIGDGRFGADVYLACVYGVYVYTTVRLRMTQEFNQFIPGLPELARRLLGVHGMEL